MGDMDVDIERLTSVFRANVPVSLLSSGLSWEVCEKAVEAVVTEMTRAVSPAPAGEELRTVSVKSLSVIQEYIAGLEGFAHSHGLLKLTDEQRSAGRELFAVLNGEGER